MSAAEAARAAEVEARLAVRTAEERANAVRGRADSLRRAAAAEREARLRAQRAREARELAAAVAAAVAESGRLVAAALSATVAVASRTRDELAAERRLRGEALAKAREEVDRTHRQDHRAHRCAAPRRSRQSPSGASHRAARAARARAVRHGRRRSGGRVRARRAAAADGAGDGRVRAGPRARGTGHRAGADAVRPAHPGTPRQAAERELAELGRVNPLALEEFAALEERYNFLSTQLEDVKAARKDLLDVIADVDDRILQVFTEAYADVEREFREVFATLFPGGEGQLLLTDPDDMLTTGIEVEARPPGKKIKRLSLLSGGEKSLTAVAMLVAIFRARPSPFYVMDEVEAALDDVNLRRLISLFEQLRERSPSSSSSPTRSRRWRSPTRSTA